MATRNRRETKALLLELTEMVPHERFRPIDRCADSEFKSTGESNAAIEDSKRKLDRSGALYHWIEIAREYLLNDINVSPDRIEETDVQYDWLSIKPTPSQGG